MKKLIIIAAAALVFAGCKSVRVSTPEWSAHYWSCFQSNDVQGLKVSAGRDIALEIQQTKSGIDPAAAEALKTAASALAVASRACAACASGGVSEAAAATINAAAADCVDCEPTP